MNILAIAWLALGLVWAIGFGSRAAWVAGDRNRRPQLWFLFGAVLGPGALAILTTAPPGVCARCLSPVVGWSMTCALCGEDVRANPMVDLMLGSEPVQAQPVPAPMAATSPAAAPAPAIVQAPATVPAAAMHAATRANDVPPSDASPTRGRTAAARAAAGTARPSDNARPASEPGAARRVPVKPGPATEPAAERRPTYVAPPAAQPASTRQTPQTPPAPVAGAAAVTNAATDASPAQRTGEPQLDLDVRRPMRLASCVFVEGTEALVPGMWYQLTSEGGALSITGPQGSLPNGSAISRPLAEVQVKASGDRLVVTGASGEGEDLRLVFKSTLDWTPLGLTREVDARRRALDNGAGNA